MTKAAEETDEMADAQPSQGPNRMAWMTPMLTRCLKPVNKHQRSALVADDVDGDTGEVSDLTKLYDTVDPAALCHHILSNTLADQFVGAMESSFQNNVLAVMAKAGSRVAQFGYCWWDLCRLKVGKGHLLGACCEGQDEGKEKIELYYWEKEDVFESTFFFSRLG